jgi:hypothetical protein
MRSWRCPLGACAPGGTQSAKFVLDHHRVEGLIVNAEAPGTVTLLHQQHRRREGGCAWSDDPSLPHGDALPLQLLLLDMCVSIWMHNHWQCLEQDPDVMAMIPLWRQAKGLGEENGEVGQ